MEEKKRAPSIKCFSSLLKYMAFFYYDYFNFFLSIKMRVFIILPSSVIKFECKYLLLLLLCTASQTNQQKIREKKINFTGKKIILFSTQTTFELCRKPILYISPLPFPFILLIEQQQKAPNFIIPTHILFFHMSKNAYRIPSDEKRIE